MIGIVLRFQTATRQIKAGTIYWTPSWWWQLLVATSFVLSVPVAMALNPENSIAGRAFGPVVAFAGAAWVLHARWCGLVVGATGVQVRRMWRLGEPITPWPGIDHFDVQPANQGRCITVAVVGTDGQSRWTRALILGPTAREQAASVQAKLEAKRPSTPLAGQAEPSP